MTIEALDRTVAEVLKRTGVDVRTLEPSDLYRPDLDLLRRRTK